MQKETGTNERTNTDTPDPYDLFSRGLRQSMKWKLKKTRRRRDAQRIRQKYSFIDNIANRKTKLWRTKLIKGEQSPLTPMAGATIFSEELNFFVYYLYLT